MASLVLAAAACGVTPEEKLVGAWSVDVAGSTVPAVELPGGKGKASDYLSNLHMKILADHSFVISLGAMREGTWSYAPGVVTLTPKGAGPTGPVQAQLSPDEENMTIDEPTPFGEAKVKFRKSG